MIKLNEYLAKIDELSLRERVIIFGGILFVIFYCWYVYLMEPIAKEEKKLFAELASKREQIQTLNDQFTKMASIQRDDPNAKNRVLLQDLREKVQKIRTEIMVATENLVAPQIMPDLLRSVLTKSKGLKLVSLKGLGGAPLIAQNKQAQVPGENGQTGTDNVNNQNQQTVPDKEDALDQAYKHGMQIEFTGNFFDTLSYIRTLENLQWSFFWDNIDFGVIDFPTSTTTLTVYTISLNKNWISI